MKPIIERLLPEPGPLVIEKSSGNLFTDFGFSKAKATNFAMRTDCMIAIESWFVSSGLTRSLASKQLGIKPSRFEAILNGEVEQFTIDLLLNVAVNAGLTAKLTLKVAKKKAA
jgi:predicted XRE-type DNA-binding protein